MTVVSESGFRFGFGGWMITYSVESITVGTGTGIGTGWGIGLDKSLVNLKWAIVIPYVSDGPSPLNSIT